MTLFKICGVSVTKKVGSLARLFNAMISLQNEHIYHYRAVVDNSRTVVIWGIGIVLTLNV